MRPEVKHLILLAEKTLNVDEVTLENLERLGDLSSREVRALHVLRHMIYDQDLLRADSAAQDQQREVLRSLLDPPLMTSSAAGEGKDGEKTREHGESDGDGQK